MLERRGHARGDSAVSDMVGTILLVGLVVLLGSVVAVMVVGALDQSAAPPSSVSLARVAPGDAAVRLAYSNGEPVSLEALSIKLARGDGAFVAVPRANWTTADSTLLRPGGTLSIQLVPVAAQNETIRLRVVRTDLNFLFADLGSRAGLTTALLPVPTLNATLAPATLPADGVTATLLAVHVSHPAGDLAVASVLADVSAPSRASGSALSSVALQDDGRDGDLVGGDGVWSGLYSLSPATPPGPYVIRFELTDASGRVVGNSTATLTATPAPTGGDQMGTGASGQSGAVGTTFRSPSPQNVTAFRLRNFTWDQLHPERLDDDFILLRIAGASGAWSGRLKLEDVAGVAYAIELRMWTQTYETVYTPLNGTHLPLAGLDLDLLNPVASGQWKWSTGDADPRAVFSSAAVGGEPRFVLPYLGQDKATANGEASLETGLISVEVVLT